jgi:hypothetical protein
MQDHTHIGRLLTNMAIREVSHQHDNDNDNKHVIIAT